MNATTTVESTAAQKAAYGGLIDSLGGIAVAVLAIVGLTGFDPHGMAAIATIVFGAALLAQGGTILFEYTSILSATSASVSDIDRTGAEGLPTLFLVGAGGIVLGILALLGIAPAALTSAAVIAFGSGLVLSSGVVRQLSQLQADMLPPAPPRTGNELFAGQMVAGSASFQALAGLATIVLGIIAVVADPTPKLVALLLLGITVLFTGSTLSGLVLSFFRSSRGEQRLQRGSM